MAPAGGLVLYPCLVPVPGSYVPVPSSFLCLPSSRPARPCACCGDRAPFQPAAACRDTPSIRRRRCRALVLHDVELELREHGAHVVVTVLRLHDDLVEALRDGPRFRFLGERAEMALAAPVAPRGADPRIEDAAVVEVDAAAQPLAPDRAASARSPWRGSRGRLCTKPARACRGRRAAAPRPSG